MTNISYKDGLINEFIKNETDYQSRQENLKAIIALRKEKDREKKKRITKINRMIAFALILVLLIYFIFMGVYVVKLMTPKTMYDIENKYDVTYYSHIVKDGETVSSIRNDILDDHPEILDKITNKWNYLRLILECNDLENPNRIYPGQEILYPVF